MISDNDINDPDWTLLNGVWCGVIHNLASEGLYDMTPITIDNTVNIIVYDTVDTVHGPNKGSCAISIV